MPRKPVISGAVHNKRSKRKARRSALSPLILRLFTYRPTVRQWSTEQQSRPTRDTPAGMSLRPQPSPLVLERWSARQLEDGGGWGHWGANWHGGNVSFNRNAYVSRSNAFVNRNSSFNQFNRANVNRNAINRNAATRNAVNQGIRNKPSAGTFNRPSGVQNFDRGAGQFNRERQSAATSRGFSGGDRSSIGSRSGGFTDFRQGGSARFDSARGRSSFGGGGSRGGGGGFRGGGGGRGGGRR